MSGCVWGAAPPLLLEALGRLWEVQAPLGSGSSASVYRVRCCGDPRAPPGAVKEFVPPPARPGPARRPGARPPAADCAEYGFRKERAALEQLRGHRNIGNGPPAPVALPAGWAPRGPAAGWARGAAGMGSPDGGLARWRQASCPGPAGREVSPSPAGLLRGSRGWAPPALRCLDVVRRCLPQLWSSVGGGGEEHGRRAVAPERGFQPVSLQ